MLTKIEAPTLEDLRSHASAAWLWDGARGRIVWANPAGVAYFSGESLFDLIDRPFDYAEPGVEHIMGLSKRLSWGQIETALLHFPSSGHTAPLACRCSVHSLADGRAGLLVIAEGANDGTGEIPAEKIAQAFDLLPAAAAFVGRDGSLHHLNAAAHLLLGAGQRSSLGALIENSPLADDLLSRLASTGTVSDVMRLRTRIGQREIRLTLRKLGSTPDLVAFAMVLLDDITERRALERSISTRSQDPGEYSGAKPQLAAADAEAFHHLGKVLAESAVERTPAAIALPDKPRRKPAAIPLAVTAAIDKLGHAILITKGGHVLHANPKACAIFGYASVEDFINDDSLWRYFGTLAQSVPLATVTLEDGREVSFTAQLSGVAWQNGPAQQFTLKPAAAPVSKIAEVQPAPSLQAAAEPEELPPTPAGREEIHGPESVQGSQPVADDELRAILDTATDGIITLDRDGKIHTFSAGAEAIFGYRIAEVADKPFGDLLTAESRKVLRDYLAALQGPGLASVFNDGREVSAIVKQGGTVPLFLTIGPLQSLASRAAFCAVVRDITQWKRTEAELREAKEVAEATSRQKSEFLARISHELRTPLNAIMGFSEVMRLERFGEIKNEKYRGYVNDIHSSGGLLLSLINDLLDLSKVEAGQLELNFTAVNLSDTADNAIKMLQEAATGARVVIRKAMPGDLPNVVADQRSMRQIMLNILSNAIKFTDPGGQVIVSALTNKSGELKLRVKDTGIGMNDEQLRDALEPFKRVSTEGREVQGTGLGLPLTKALAEANRTKFSISSEPRKGTLIEITFPTTRVLAE
ncbi:MAG: PAS domain S-box protein [Aestuariivirga sp.]